jgi:hypothetical protein
MNMGNIEMNFNSIIADDNSKIKKKPKKNKVRKVTNTDFSIPSISQYLDFQSVNYNVKQLKEIAKHYNLKVSGNKGELNTRIFSYLHRSCNSIKVQKKIRGYLVRKFISLHGPASFNRSICCNECDIVTLDPITSIPFNNFFSFNEGDFHYGFEVASFYNLIFKSHNSKSVKNPYTQNIISYAVIKDLLQLIRISSILDINLELSFDNGIQELTTDTQFKLKIVSLFQKIDELGSYTDVDWFFELSNNQLIRFIREIYDIWTYRANISLETKRQIIPPHGTSSWFNIQYQYYSHASTKKLNNIVYNIIDTLINSGIDTQSQYLGSFYVLGALTIVNHRVAEAIPWLYQSFNY